jgi:hypothetical protein
MQRLSFMGKFSILHIQNLKTCIEAVRSKTLLGKTDSNLLFVCLVCVCLHMWPRLASNSWSSCLSLTAGIICVKHHAQSFVLLCVCVCYWGLNLELFLPGRHFTTWTMTTALFLLWLFWRYSLAFCPELQSYLNDKCTALTSFFPMRWCLTNFFPGLA